MADYSTFEKQADNSRIAASKLIINPADGTHTVMNLPKYAFVTRVWIEITDASAAGTLSIGFTGDGAAADTDGFMDTTACDITSLGLLSSDIDAQPGSYGKWFNTASGQITITTSSANDGTYQIFAEYYVLH